VADTGALNTGRSIAVDGEQRLHKRFFARRGRSGLGRIIRMNALLAFAATLVALRLAAELVRRWRRNPAPELLAWSAALLAYTLATAALAWGSAAGWSEAAFRAYYLFGGLLTAPLLGAGSLLRVGASWVTPVALLYVGLATGVAVAEPLTSALAGTDIPAADEHLDFFPARLLAIAGNSLGTLAVVAVALRTLRRRPLGNGLVLAGVATAALGTALAGLGVAGTAVFVAVAAVLLYGGFVVRG
jgi:hypothetical protein